MSTTVVLIALVLGLTALILCTVKFKVHPFFSLVIASLVFGIVSGMEFNTILDSFTSGLGNTIAGIGIIIVIGTITGELLEKSGAAESMAQTILKITGPKHAALGLALTGYFVSIPVFCDSAFVLLSPIAKRLSRDTKVSMTTMAVSLAMGLHATHMLVPPTPGPLAVSGILNANLGTVIALGALVSIPVTFVGYFIAVKVGKKHYFLPEELEEILVENHRLPSPLMSFGPIVVPIILMILQTIASMIGDGDGNTLIFIINIIGQPIVALMIGLVLALITYLKVHPKDYQVWSFEGAFGDAMKTAGQIALIVGAGGAFGAILQKSPLNEILVNTFSGMNIGILAPFLIGAIFRTAIGSGTVAMVTAATMLAQVLEPLGMTSPIGRVIAMLACAAGGFMVFHGNDDFFWVVTSTSGMDTETAYKTIPLGSIAQSFTALAIVFALYVVLL
ncbi:GntP family permease [Clostridium sp.]|uniref:GntP family permease n=1 Tax=Clostridium sp. TaxID=1506 RepID=UPI003463BCB8